jgi:hypothetical protein
MKNFKYWTWAKQNNYWEWKLQENGSITLNQRKYTMGNFKRFGMENCSIVSTSAIPSIDNKNIF